MEIGQQPPSIDLTHTTLLSTTSSNFPDAHSSIYSLRPGKRRDYKKLARPIASKVLLQHALSPNTPLYIGTALKDKLRHHWIDCIFAAYDKMHTSGTLSYSFSTSYINKHNPTILPSRLSFEIQITHINNFTN